MRFSHEVNGQETRKENNRNGRPCADSIEPRERLTIVRGSLQVIKAANETDLEALRANQWNRRKAAVALKISYRALIYKIRDAGLLSRRQGMLAESASAKGLRPNSPTPPGD